MSAPQPGGIGFIGLGDMGGAIAERLLQMGARLHVLDVRDDVQRKFAGLGAKTCRTAAEVARASDVLFTCLPGPQEMRAVAFDADGISSGLHPGMIYVDLTTNSPDLVREVSDVFARSSVEVLDGPVSGGSVGAKAGKLAVFIGGPRQTFERVLPVLHLFGDEKVRYCGPLGSGNLVKLCNNLINNVLKCLLPEVFALGIKAGVESRYLFDHLTHGLGDSAMLRMLAANALDAGLKGSFPGVAVKDVGLATELARQWRVRIPIGVATLDRLRESLERGYGLNLWEMLEHDAEVIMKYSVPPPKTVVGLPQPEVVAGLCEAVLAAAMSAINPEAFAIGIRGGVPQDTLYQSIIGGTGSNAVLERYFLKVLQSPTRGPLLKSGLPHIDKADVRSALQIADQLRVPMPIAQAVFKRMSEVETWQPGAALFELVEFESSVRFAFQEKS